MSWIEDALSNPWFGILGLARRSDAFHPTTFGYAVALLVAFVAGFTVGALRARLSRSYDGRDDIVRRIEPRL